MAEQKNKQVEEQIDNTPIDGQVAIDEKGIADIKAGDKKEKTDNCADHISRTKVLDVINNTMAKYESKIVLAMSEVRDIIKAITTAVNE